MSRTTKATKPAGISFWGRRPFNRHGIHGTGKPLKQRTHKAERAEGRAQARSATND